VRAALDTNVLAYAEGVNGAVMKKAALDLLEALPGGTAVVPVQALGELFNLLRRQDAPQPKPHSAVLDSSG
jgi:predicted nucleic acid-binding protein